MLDKTRCKTFSYSRCFITTLDDDQMRTAVWWTKPKIGFLMEPHRGFPHIKASVYDCPSNGGRVVYEYMRFKFLFRKSFSCNMVPCSTTMANDARLGGSVVPEVCGLCHDVAYRSPFHEHSPCRAFYVMSFLIVRSSIGSGLEMWKPWLSTSLIACACWPMFLPAPFLTLSFSFFVEVSNFDPAASNSPHFLSPRSDNPAEFRLSACVLLFLRSGVS